MKRPLKFALYAFLALTGIGLLLRVAGVQPPAAGARDQASLPPTPAAGTTAPLPVKAPGQSLAHDWAGRVKAEIDITQFEQFQKQMPENIQPQSERSGENPKFTWTFADHSAIVATFRPRSGEGSGNGLVLYMVEFKN